MKKLNIIFTSILVASLLTSCGKVKTPATAIDEELNKLQTFIGIEYQKAEKEFNVFFQFHFDELTQKYISQLTIDSRSFLILTDNDGIIRDIKLNTKQEGL